MVGKSTKDKESAPTPNKHNKCFEARSEAGILFAVVLLTWHIVVSRLRYAQDTLLKRSDRYFSSDYPIQTWLIFVLYINMNYVWLDVDPVSSPRKLSRRHLVALVRFFRVTTMR